MADSNQKTQVVKGGLGFDENNLKTSKLKTRADYSTNLDELDG